MTNPRMLNGRRYVLSFGCDVIRDGVFLELSDQTEEAAEVLADIFFYDEMGKAVFSAYKEDLPLQLIHWLVDAAVQKGWPIK